MELVTVNSSVIHAIGYDQERQQLEIVFTNGRPYRYTGVPPEVYRQLMQAESKGRYFLANIRDSYPYIPLGRWRRSARRALHRSSATLTPRELLELANRLPLRDRLSLAEQILATAVTQMPAESSGPASG